MAQAFVMSLTRTKRVKYVGQDGAETFQEENRWQFLNAEELASAQDEETASKDGEAAKAEGGDAKQLLTPKEVLARIYAARGEVELILDLVANVEDGQHLAVANVAPPKSTLTGLTNQRALQLQSKQQTLQDAAARLRRGAELLGARLEREQGYYGAAAQLQRHWKLRASPPGCVAPLEVDISLPFTPRGRREARAPLLPLLSLPDGRVRLQPDLDAAESQPARPDAIAGSAAAESPPMDPGGWGRADVQAVHAQLHARQRRLLWASVQGVIEAEAAESDASGIGHEIAAQLVSQAMVHSSLGALLLGLYLQCLDDEKKGVLEGARAWLGHLPFRDTVRASLQRQVTKLPQMTLRWLPASGVARSAVQIIACRGRAPLLLLLAGEGTLLLEGVAPILASTCAAGRESSMYISKQELETLLEKLSTSWTGV